MWYKSYSEEQIANAKKYISCDALLILVMNALERRKGFSIVRMGDGEASILRYKHRGTLSKHLTDKDWLKEYGLLGADLRLIAAQVWLATEQADVYCPNISGLCLDKYEIISLGKERELYGEGLFAHTWLYMGRVNDIMALEQPIGIVCRNSKEVALKLFDKYSKPDIETAEYNSWSDYETALETIGKMKSNLIFVAGGASGKYLIVQAAKQHNKVVIDAGSALVRHWSEQKTRKI